MKKNFYDNAWVHYQKETGLKLTAHQLRHGNATIMLEAGLDAKDRQALLGHADITTTQNIYTDVSERRRDIIAEKLNQYIQ